MTSTHEEASDVIPPMPRAPRTPSIAEAKDPPAPLPKKRSEVAAAGALFVFLLGLMTIAIGAVTLVMFV